MNLWIYGSLQYCIKEIVVFVAASYSLSKHRSCADVIVCLASLVAIPTILMIPRDFVLSCNKKDIGHTTILFVLHTGFCLNFFVMNYALHPENDCLMLQGHMKLISGLPRSPE